MADFGWLTIPINPMGEREYNSCIEHTDNMIEYKFPKKEYYSMVDDDTMGNLWDECEINISDYESEEIPYDKVEQAMSIVDKDKHPVFYQALEDALKYKSFIAVDL